MVATPSVEALLDQAAALRKSSDHAGAIQIEMQAMEAEQARSGESMATTVIGRRVALDAAALEKPDVALNFLGVILETRMKLTGNQSAAVAEIYTDLADIYEAQKDYPKAEASYRRALDTYLAALGPGDALTATANHNLAYDLGLQGREADALPFYHSALASCIAAHGEQSARTATAHTAVATVLYNLDRNAEAEPYYEKALAISLAEEGTDTPLVATRYANMGNNLRALNRLADAEAAIRKALLIRRVKLGYHDPATLMTIGTLARLLRDDSRPGEAEPLLREASAAETALHGPQSAEVAAISLQLAGSLTEQGRFADADPLLKNALAIRLAVLGDKHPGVAQAYDSLATNLDLLGRFEDGEAMNRKSLAIRQAVFGDDGLGTSYSYEALGLAAHDRGRYTEAEPLLRKALAIRLAKLGKDSLETASAGNFLAVTLDAMGRTAEAETLFREALAVRVAHLSERDPKIATSYNNVAYSLATQGRFAEAEPLYRKALAIRLAALGKGHTLYAQSLLNLADAVGGLGRSAEVEALQREALAIRLAALGPDHPDVAATYNNLAATLSATGRHPEAEAIYRKALAITQAAFGEQNPATATALNNLAHVVSQQDKFTEAEGLYRKTLGIRLATLGPDHPDVANIYANLAKTVMYRNQMAEAETLSASGVTAARHARRINGASRSTLADIRGPMRASDDENFALIAYLNVASWAVHESADAELVRARAFTVAQDIISSASANAMAKAAARAAAGKSAVAVVIRQQQDLAAAAAALDARFVGALGGKDAAATQALREQLDVALAGLAAIDSRIDLDFPEYRAIISPDAMDLKAVQRALAPDEGLLLMVASQGDVHSFGVTSGGIAWSVLRDGEAGVRKRIAHLRCQVDVGHCGQLLDPSEVVPDGEAHSPRFDLAAANTLYTDLIAPIEAKLANVKRLYITTSSALGDLPLGLLVTAPPAAGTNDSDPGTLAAAPWLADRYALTYLPAVAGLRLKPVKQAEGRPTFVGYGDPVLLGNGIDILSRSAKLFRGVGRSGQPLADVAMLRTAAPLPHTSIELAGMALSLGVPPAGTVHLQQAATESAVKADPALRVAGIVAFATHGLLPGDVEGFDEPGLILTPPYIASDDDDGLLSASEAAQLTLSADLVILSACNTASTEGAHGADSLSSLARGFLYAGADALLASHWAVADDATAALTVEMLTNRQTGRANGVSRAQALQAAMHAVRTGRRTSGAAVPGYDPRWAHPAAWAPFTHIANRDR
ncbi:MAG: CHAT domain-containing tetratricopeptide repeat protein [Pseudomonadota bacterium]